MKRLICTCCGAPINRIKKKCEYCGTEYIIEDDRPVLNIETFTNPVKEYKACVIVPNEVLFRGGEEYMKAAIHQLAAEMMPAVVEGMQIRTEANDPMRCEQKITGRIRIVIPKNG